MRKEWIPFALIAALGAAAIYYFGIRVPPPGDRETDGPLFLLPAYPIGPLEEPPAEIRWRPIEQAKKYRVELFDQLMTLVWSKETSESSIAFPAEQKEALLRGEALFYTIDARGNFGKEIVRSEPVLIRLDPPPGEGETN